MDLSPQQEFAYNDLIRRGWGRVCDPKLSVRLVDYLVDSLESYPLAGVSLSKQGLKTAEQCPGRFDAHLRGEDYFRMTPEFAVGRVLHRAAEVEAGAREELPLFDVIDHAIHRLCDDRYHSDFGEFWSGADEPTRAEVRGGAATALDMLRASLPPLLELRRQGMPSIPELPLSFELPSGLRLSGRIDLCLGTVRSGVATRLLLDLKTGGGSKSYAEDMRLYALLHTLRYRWPPYRVATIFLPGGTYQAEEVNEESLFHAADRFVQAAASAHHLLENGANEEDLTPGPHCAWCPRRTVCPAAL